MHLNKYVCINIIMALTILKASTAQKQANILIYVSHASSVWAEGGVRGSFDSQVNSKAAKRAFVYTDSSQEAVNCNCLHR